MFKRINQADLIAERRRQDKKELAWGIGFVIIFIAICLIISHETVPDKQAAIMDIYNIKPSQIDKSPEIFGKNHE